MATWVQDPDSTGTNNAICMQALDNECGACCVAMIARIAANRNIDVQQARAKIFEYEKAALSRDNLHMSLDDSSTALALWTTHGALTSSYTQALSEFGVKNAYGGNRVAGAVDLVRLITTRTSRLKPGLLTVAWTGGGGHAVVVMGPIGANNDILILDPGFGRQEIPQANFPAYATAPTAIATATNGVAAGNAGTFNFEIVTTA
jgi:hypothetical protein